MIQVTLRGNTYGIKDTLKGLGFKWNQSHKDWVKIFDDSEENEANEIARRWYSEGVYGEIIRK